MKAVIHQQLKAYYRQCANRFGDPKIKFEEEDAIEQAALLSYKSDKDVTPYQCAVCGSWHIGSLAND